MTCSDPFITYLKSFGYNVIRLPKADVKPLEILVQQGADLNRLGDLTALLVAGENVPYPAISANTPAANIAGQRTADLSIGVGLSILGTLIGAMGGSKLGLDGKYHSAKTAAFEFQDVFEDRVEVARLDQYLADADVNPYSRYVGDLLDADEIFVTTAVIKSNKITVEARKSDGTGLELSIPEIQGVSAKVTYTGPVPLVFGFQAYRLFYDKGHYTALQPLLAGAAGMRGLGDEEPRSPQPFVAPGAFARLGAA
jgi:hypothetical protein